MGCTPARRAAIAERNGVCPLAARCSAGAAPSAAARTTPCQCSRALSCRARTAGAHALLCGRVQEDRQCIRGRLHSMQGRHDGLRIGRRTGGQVAHALGQGTASSCPPGIRPQKTGQEGGSAVAAAGERSPAAPGSTRGGAARREGRYHTGSSGRVQPPQGRAGAAAAAPLAPRTEETRITYLHRVASPAPLKRTCRRRGGGWVGGAWVWDEIRRGGRPPQAPCRLRL